MARPMEEKRGDLAQESRQRWACSRRSLRIGRRTAGSLTVYSSSRRIQEDASDSGVARARAGPRRSKAVDLGQMLLARQQPVRCGERIGKLARILGTWNDRGWWTPIAAGSSAEAEQIGSRQHPGIIGVPRKRQIERTTAPRSRRPPGLRAIDRSGPIHIGQSRWPRFR